MISLLSPGLAALAELDICAGIVARPSKTTIVRPRYEPIPPRPRTARCAFAGYVGPESMPPEEGPFLHPGYGSSGRPEPVTDAELGIVRHSTIAGRGVVARLMRKR